MAGGRGPEIHAVILAGGAGERFWPASRSSVPKPFLRVVGDQTLLDGTLERARRFAAEDRIWIVCGEEHARDERAEEPASEGSADCGRTAANDPRVQCPASRAELGQSCLLCSEIGRTCEVLEAVETGAL